MSSLNSFHEVRFPTDLALGATGGPQRRTEVITLGSGAEQRNTRWANSRRRYNAGYGVKTLDDLHLILEFFEERRGQLFGFRFRDPMDWKSCSPNQQAKGDDQFLGEGDGTTHTFQLQKRYGSVENGYVRKISKPVDGSLLVEVEGTSVPEDNYQLDWTSGEIEFGAEHIPSQGEIISAGFEFDVPVRFDTDEIAVNLGHFEAGDIPSIPLMELLS